jgi:hypothetical protein
MIAFPYRLAFFLAALVALGVYAAAVNLPHSFQAGDPIRAGDVNANFATLASAVESRAMPSELIVTPGINQIPFELERAFSDLDETVVTTTPGRWLLSKFVSVSLNCSSAGSVPQYYLTVNGTPVRASMFFAPQGQAVRATLTGLTEEVLPAGTHEVRLYGDCPASDWTSSSTSVRSISSVVVFPEAP